MEKGWKSRQRIDILITEKNNQKTFQPKTKKVQTESFTIEQDCSVLV